jgi:PAS domain-containing protein
MKWDQFERRKSLREKAEELVEDLKPHTPSNETAEVLLHQLLVHKIELELQNEELQKTHHALEAARDCFKNLYNLAPVGFMALNRDELITEINHTGCTLLGIDPNKLNNLRFSSFVAHEDRDDWFRLFRQMFHANCAEKKRIDLQLIRSDSWSFKVHLICVFLPSSEIIATPILRLAFTDISEVESIKTIPQ